MKKSARTITWMITAVITLFLISAGFAWAEVNIRVKNTADKVNRLVNHRFLPGYHLIIRRDQIKKGAGKLGGDAEVVREFFPKTTAEYRKMLNSGNITTTRYTRIIIHVEVFNSPREASQVKIDKMETGTLTGEPLGERAWSATIPKMDVKGFLEANEPGSAGGERKLTAKEQAEKEKKERDLAHKLSKDLTNFNIRKLVVLNGNIILEITAVNYNEMPPTRLLEDIARQLLVSI